MPNQLDLDCTQIVHLEETIFHLFLFEGQIGVFKLWNTAGFQGCINQGSKSKRSNCTHQIG